MDEKAWINYMKNRTVDDIMEEYGEQRDEWETLLIVRDGKTVYEKKPHDHDCESNDGINQ